MMEEKHSKKILENEKEGREAFQGKLYRVFITVMLVVIGIQIILPYAVPDADMILVVLGAAFPVFFMLGYYFCGMRGRIILSLVLLLCLCIPLVLYGNETMPVILRGFWSWITGLGEWMEEYRNEYHFAAILLISLALCAAAVWVDRFATLRRLLCLGFLVYLIVSLVQGQECSQGSVACILLYCIACGVEYVQAAGKPGGGPTGKKSVVYLFPFLALYLALMLVIPADQKPYDWQFVKSMMDQIEKGRIILSQKWGSSSGEGFGLQFTGFGGSADVGGNIASRSRDEMIVRASSELKTNLYLTGRVYDTFRENEWLSTYSEETQEYQLDFLETMYAVKRYDPQKTSDYVRPVSITIAYQELNSRYLFAPVKTYKIIQKNNNAAYRTQGGEIVFRDVMGYGTEYSLWFLQMNLDHPGFYEMVAQESTYRYGEENHSRQDILSKLISDYLPDMRAVNMENKFSTENEFSTENSFSLEDSLLTRAQEIRRVYWQDPELSEEVSAYLAEITAGCESVITKLKAIEQELKQYTYTTSPGRIPKGVEFLDYFLLETKEGYCTYFATAFILLARAEGIPARYVQGFSVPVYKSNITGIQVSSSMAHAWPEVYLEGVGWIPFEPTPDYGEIRYQPWRTQAQAGQTDARIHYEVVQPVEEIPQAPSEAVWEETKMEETEETVRYDIAAGFLLVLLGGIVLVFTGDYLLRRYRYGKWDAARKLHAEVDVNIRLLGILGFTLQEGETITELRSRVVDSGKVPQIPLAFIPLFEEVRYGGTVADSGLLTVVLAEKRLLFEAIKNESRIKYYWFRIKIG